MSRRVEREAADRLLAAAATGVACAPVAELIGLDDVHAAYRVQSLVVDRRLADGATIIGRKIGLTAKGVQEQVGVDRPDFGVLLDQMAYADGDTVPMSRLLQPRAEAEVAFVLGTDLTGPLDSAAIRRSVSSAVAAIEIVDSRIADWDIAITDTIADNASSGVFVLGREALTLEHFEPVDVVMEMIRNGETVSRGNGWACLDDPLNALAWLARTAIDVGSPLRAGDIVLSGALGPMIPVEPGDVIEAKIEPLGSLSVRFSKEDRECP